MNIFNTPFKQLNLANSDIKTTQLIQQEVNQFQIILNQKIINEEYQIFLLTVVKDVDLNLTEAELLEQIVPLWTKHRHQEIPKNTPIDDFYRHFEHTLLLTLISELFLSNDLSSSKIKKAREIIRRYSIMPTLWQYICKRSGDTPIKAYTF